MKRRYPPPEVRTAPPPLMRGTLERESRPWCEPDDMPPEQTRAVDHKRRTDENQLEDLFVGRHYRSKNVTFYHRRPTNTSHCPEARSLGPQTEPSTAHSATPLRSLAAAQAHHLSSEARPDAGAEPDTDALRRVRQAALALVQAGQSSGPRHRLATGSSRVLCCGAWGLWGPGGWRVARGSSQQQQLIGSMHTLPAISGCGHGGDPIIIIRYRSIPTSREAATRSTRRCQRPWPGPPAGRWPAQPSPSPNRTRGWRQMPSPSGDFELLGVVGLAAASANLQAAS